MPSYAYTMSNSFGYLFNDEVDFLKLITRNLEKEDPVFVNIGIGAATSIYAVWEEKPKTKIYAVDLVGDMGEAQFREGHLAEYAGLVRMVGDSKELAKMWPDDLKIDLLFIDGDHSYQGAWGDFIGWTPYLAEGGVVVVHDYDSVNWGDVKKAVDECFADWYRIGLVHTLVAFTEMPPPIDSKGE